MFKLSKGEGQFFAEIIVNKFDKILFTMKL